MDSPHDYGPVERRWLWLVGAVGLVGLNTVFLYGLLRPEVIQAALTNPVSLAFIAEAFVLMGLLAYLLPRWGVARLHWGWFVGLSLLGSLAFALPAMVLWPRGGGPTSDNPSEVR